MLNYCREKHREFARSYMTVSCSWVWSTSRYRPMCYWFSTRYQRDEDTQKHHVKRKITTVERFDSHGGVATSSTYGVMGNAFCCKLTAASNSKRILKKVDQRLSQLRKKFEWHAFWTQQWNAEYMYVHRVKGASGVVIFVSNRVKNSTEPHQH